MGVVHRGVLITLSIEGMILRAFWIYQCKFSEGGFGFDKGFETESDGGHNCGFGG